MSADRLRGFRFSTPAHWNTCLFVEADEDALQSGKGVRPFAAYAHTATISRSNGAHAPVVTRGGEIMWRDDRGCLHHLCSADDDTPEVFAAAAALGAADRIVASSHGLWVNGTAPDSLQRYDEESFTRVLTVDLGDSPVIDLAAGQPGSVIALVTDGDDVQAVTVSAEGHVSGMLTLAHLQAPSAFVYLRRTQRFVVLAGTTHPRLYWFRAKGGEPIFSMAAAALHPCFRPAVLGTDGRDRVFIAGTDGEEFGGGAFVIMCDADGNILGDLPLDAPASGMTATREYLFVTGPLGLLRFAPADEVPEGAEQAQCTLLTPMLNAPEREDGRRWLRIDAQALLPEGSVLDLSFASTADAEVRDRLNRIAGDRTLRASQRLAAMREEPDVWHRSTEFHGSAALARPRADPLSAKLFDVADPYIWACVRLTAAAGARLPVLSELSVLYPGRSLMESLPAIYQRDEAQPDGFLRSLVGVLEATTQGLDSRIGSLGTHLDSSTAPEEWLDFVARWIGVPWDDAFDLRQKRAVIGNAAALARGRGTREGLEALLVSLVPGTPRRFRVTDTTADNGFAIVGDASRAGSALPAMLAGGTRWTAELDSRAVLGYMRLPCPNQLDDGVFQLTGKIAVEIAATASERRAWQPWLRSVIGDMVPLTARLELRWVTPHAFQTDRLDGSLRLEAPPSAQLGTDAITGLAHLPEQGARLSGSVISTRLR
jgi:phage tail-like protein